MAANAGAARAPKRGWRNGETETGGAAYDGNGSTPDSSSTSLGTAGSPLQSFSTRPEASPCRPAKARQRRSRKCELWLRLVLHNQLPRGRVEVFAKELARLPAPQTIVQREAYNGLVRELVPNYPENHDRLVPYQSTQSSLSAEDLRLCDPLKNFVDSRGFANRSPRGGGYE